MTIDKAIEIMTGLIIGDYKAEASDFTPALKLGIEALKAIRSDRLAKRPEAITWLTGEDK